MNLSKADSTAALTLQALRNELLAARDGRGIWTGRLSDSALATATAVSALSEYKRHSLWPAVARGRITELIGKGITWCIARQNPDGGWGDTEASHSNIATTLLVVSAIRLSGISLETIAGVLDRADLYSRQACGTTVGNGHPAAFVAALKTRYGKDKTFAVPILANCAIAGLVPWQLVPPLPCEAALVPQGLFRFVNLPVVSYAIPALIAIGQARLIASPPVNPLTRFARRISIKRGLDLLNRMQPGSGGYLEAIPLTAFVAMSLAHSGRADHDVTHKCIQFIDESFRDEGNSGTWPIDTNLATWNTTLAINAIGFDSPDGGHAAPPHLSGEMLDWLLGCQYQTVHPFTGAAPGGWGWSNLSGAVPDADDTPGALLALRHWWQLEHLPGEARERIRRSAWAGIRWLLDLQNRDKGWPTFCRGWGRYPFDRSGPDITAHVLRALVAWRPDIDDPQFGRRIDVAIAKGFAYLTAVQNEDGSWSPLWFGNQDQANEDNPVYGTAKVLMAWRDGSQSGSRPAQNGLHWFLGQQNPDGGWGGGPSRSRALSGNGLAPTDSRTSSVQETALACEVLASLSFGDGNGDDIQNAACQRGKTWLIEAVKRMEHHETWPIGFYFAKLWYYEELYPLLFATSAFRHLLAADRRSNRSNGETGGHEPSPRVTKH